jgi:hypothetical protein
VFSIYFNGYPNIGKKNSWWILLCPLALVQDDLYLDPSLMGIEEGFKIPLIPSSLFCLFLEWCIFKFYCDTLCSNRGHQ